MGDLHNLRKKAEQAVGAVVEGTVEIIVAPTQIVVDTLNGRPINEQVDDLAATVTKTTQATAELAIIPQLIAIDAATAVAGQGAGDVARIATMGAIYPVEAVSALAAYLERPDLKVDDFKNLGIDVILAGLIKGASDQLKPDGWKIPFMVRAVLARHFPDGLLDRTLYRVGKVGITLPEIVNASQSFMGSHEYAVTVPGVIVFSSSPGQDEAALKWWAHELHHAVQYEELGVAEFAKRYVDNYAALEQEAENKAAAIQF